MMNKTKTRKRRLMWLLLLVPMLGMTSVLFARTEKAVNQDNVLSVPASNEIDEEETVDNTTFQVSGKVVDEKGNPIASAEFTVISNVSGLAALVKCSSDRNGEFAYSTGKGELVTVSKQGYDPIKVSYESPSSDLTITLQSSRKQPDKVNEPNEPKSTVAPQTVKAGDVIHGFVADAETGVTIMMANVIEKDTENRIVSHALTDNEGKFSMRIVNPDDVLTISHPEYGENQRPIANGPISIKKLNTGSDDEPAMVVEEQPEFPGGTAELLQFLRKNIKYPAECKDSSIQGRVIVTFIINKDGSICEPEVVKSVHPLLDAEALRVIGLMPAWTPGRQQGKTVRVKYSVPITFRLDGSSQRPTPEWINLYNAKDETDDNVRSLLMNVARSNEELGELNTPEMRAFIDAYRSAREELQSLQDKMQEEMQALNNDLKKKTEEYQKEQEQLTESMRSSYEKELVDGQQKLTQKYQELQESLRNRSDELIGSMQPKIKEAWQSVSKSGAYICLDMPVAIPDSSVVVTPDNLESAVKDLFAGRRDAVLLPFSVANYQQIRILLSEKYADKTIFYQNVR